MDPSIGVPLLNQTRLDGVGRRVRVRDRGAGIGGLRHHAGVAGELIADVVTRIREEGGSTTSDPKRQRMRSVLIVAETTLAVVLLVGAGLLARSFERLLSVDLGFNAERFRHCVSLAGLALCHRRCSVRRSSRPCCRARRRNPNVESAGAVFGLPLTNFRYGISTSTRDGVDAERRSSRTRLTLQVRLVTPDYFKTMGIPVVKGRGFTAGDRMGSQLVAMLNQTGAARVWPDQDAMGHQLEIGTRFGLGGARAGGTVVGIVGDVRDYGPAARVASDTVSAHAQWPDGVDDDRREGAQRRSVFAGAADARVAAGARSPTCRCRRCDRWIRLRRPRSRSRVCIWC